MDDLAFVLLDEPGEGADGLASKLDDVGVAAGELVRNSAGFDDRYGTGGENEFDVVTRDLSLSGVEGNGPGFAGSFGRHEGGDNQRLLVGKMTTVICVVQPRRREFRE